MSSRQYHTAGVYDGDDSCLTASDENWLLLQVFLIGIYLKSEVFEILEVVTFLWNMNYI